MRTDLTANYKKTDSNEKVKKTEEKYQVLFKEWLPILTQLCYLLNPFTLFNCIGMSTIIFNNLFVVFSVFFALKGNQTLTTFSLAISVYLTMYPLTLVLPIALLLKKHWSSVLFMTAIWTGGLLYASFLMFRSWDFVMDTYGFNMLVSDLTPNIGLFWYFFTEVFKQYRNFYLFAYQYHVFFLRHSFVRQSGSPSDVPFLVQSRDYGVFQIVSSCG
jgi:phosphatidylinositol glycan class U